MSNYIPLTLDQCREAVIRLQQYSIWSYHTPAGLVKFKENEIEHNGRKFSVVIEQDGRIAALLKDDNAKVIYDVRITTAAPRNGNPLDNVSYHAHVTNHDELTMSDIEYGNAIAIFILSFFQRAQAFQFFARMELATIERIAADLNLASQPSIS